MITVVTPMSSSFQCFDREYHPIAGILPKTLQHSIINFRPGMTYSYYYCGIVPVTDT